MAIAVLLMSTYGFTGWEDTVGFRYYNRYACFLSGSWHNMRGHGTKVKMTCFEEQDPTWPYLDEDCNMKERDSYHQLMPVIHKRN